MVDTMQKRGTRLFFGILIVVGILWLLEMIFGPFLTKALVAKDGSAINASLISTPKFAKSADGMTISYIYEANTVLLKFPYNEPAPVGKVLFFNTTNPKKDRGFDLKTDPSKQMFIPLNDFEKGKWRVHVEWQGEDKIYTKEEIIAVQPNDWARPVH